MDVGQDLSQVFVGRPSLRGSIGKYSERFDLLEVTAEPGRHPRRPGLIAWRKSVPERFVFSVVLPRSLSALEADRSTPATLQQVHSVADSLGASWWVLRTPPSVMPGARTLRSLDGLVRHFDDGRRFAWEPRGVWNEDDARRAARSLGVHLVRDLAREDRLDDDGVVYTRLRALGAGANIGGGAAERIAERLEGVALACVVVEGSGAVRVRRALREAAAHSGTASVANDDLDEVSDEPTDEELTE